MKQAKLIKDNIYWVGVEDFNLRNFHGSLFPIETGTTYNAYLIVDEKITLIDTVEEEFIDELLERVASVIGDKPIDYIITQHAEPDHSSGFMKVMETYPNAKPFASNASVQMMLKQYFKDYHYTTVKTGDTLSTGTYTLTFVEMPMIHWPDNMLTYIESEKIAFSNDAFGQHICDYQLFDDQHALDDCLSAAKEYYANIIIPYGTQVLHKLDYLESLPFTFDIIAPAHGVIWRSYVNEILTAYRTFASGNTTNKVVIIYETVWSHTKQMAEAIAEGLFESNVEVHIYQLSKTRFPLIFNDLLDAKALIVGSGTYNNAMTYEIAGFLEKLSGCHLKNKKILGFSSYGWFPKIADTIQERLIAAGFEAMYEKGIAMNFAPSKEDLQRLQTIGNEIADKIKSSN